MCGFPAIRPVARLIDQSVSRLKLKPARETGRTSTMHRMRPRTHRNRLSRVLRRARRTSSGRIRRSRRQRLLPVTIATWRGSPYVFRFRRKETTAQRIQRRSLELSKAAPRQLRKAASQLDVPWARSWAARGIREMFQSVVLEPTMDFYIRRRATGREKLSGLRGPVILVANHRSHIDTPVILAALPRRIRKRTAVAAAADYFYKNRFVGVLVSLLFNTVPMDRRGGGVSERARATWTRCWTAAGTCCCIPRERGPERGQPAGSARRRGSGRRHNLAIIPIRVTGTATRCHPAASGPHACAACSSPRANQSPSRSASRSSLAATPASRSSVSSRSSTPRPAAASPSSESSLPSAGTRARADLSRPRRPSPSCAAPPSPLAVALVAHRGVHAGGHSAALCQLAAQAVHVGPEADGQAGRVGRAERGRSRPPSAGPPARRARRPGTA